MSTQGAEWHTMPTPIEEAVEIPYAPSKKVPGTLANEVRFERPEIERLWVDIPRCPIGVTRFIREAALAEADRRAALAHQELLEAD